MNKRTTPGNPEKARALIGRTYTISAHDLIMRIYSGDGAPEKEVVEEGACYFCLRGICTDVPGIKVSWQNDKGVDSVRICHACYSVALDDYVLSNN